ncbi:MAG: nucleoside-diphosphate sugar epimerase/dehydratase [Pseudomonadota bacterium]
MPSVETRSARTLKTLAVVGFDALVLPLALYLAFVLRLGDLWPAERLANALPLWALLQITALVLAFAAGIPSTKISTLDGRGYGKLAAITIALGVIGTAANLIMSMGVPRTVPAIFGLIYFCLLFVGRLLVDELVARARGSGGRRQRVAIYGAGSAGIQLQSAFRQSPEISVVAFADDDPKMQGVIIGGVRVSAPQRLRELAKRGKLDRILIAIPSAPRNRQAEIADDLADLPCPVQMLPGYVDLLISGSVVSGARPVNSTDLLGRSEVDLNIPEIRAAFAGTVAMVTGAGGSIGSELCRQLLSCGLKRLVLFEQSEYALFSIDRELKALADARGVELVAVLGSIRDAERVTETMRRHGVRTILHAAAYKHVPLVEANVLEGVLNNVFGTRTLAEAAREAGIDRFILVSTDKAVRPTNVMGGTKRMAEIVIQDLQKRAPDTKFAMVRFGNVLESSGSVVPIFREQIASGGPVTVTHPEMTRYFMTVPEAARLVLLAGSYAEGGEVYVLDMGQPIKIADMARRMIELSGHSVRDADTPDGDIEIVFTGPRPGEKLFEELLIGDNTLPTPHAKIQRALEDCPTQLEVASALQELQSAVASESVEAARAVLTRYAMVQPEDATKMPVSAAE